MCPLTLLCGAEDVATWCGEDATGEGGVEEEAEEEGGETHGAPGLAPRPMVNGSLKVQLCNILPHSSTDIH